MWPSGLSALALPIAALTFSGSVPAALMPVGDDGDDGVAQHCDVHVAEIVRILLAQGHLELGAVGLTRCGSPERVGQGAFADRSQGLGQTLPGRGFRHERPPRFETK